MHVQVYEWVAAQVVNRPVRAVLEVGSLDINGTVRPLFPTVEHYHGLDLVAGPGVDEVADAATWQPPRTYDAVVCAEVLEHAPTWPAILDMMWSAVAPAGILLMTCACEPRPPHSAVDGLDVRPDEHYANVDPAAVAARATGWDAAEWSVTTAGHRGDLYLRAVRA